MPIVLKIGTDRYNFFNTASIVLKYGHAASKFSLTALFDSESSIHRRIFKPLDYKNVSIESDRGDTLITGEILNNGFDIQKTQRMATISGYSKTGVLQDCSIPAGQNYQFIGLTLRQIVDQLVAPFGISVVVVNDGGEADKVIDEETATPTESVIGFLTRLAAQKNLVITNTPGGQLEISRPNASVSSIATYREGLPATKISLSVNGQQMHSDLTVMQQADLDTDNAAQETLKNIMVNDFRPVTRVQSTGDNNLTELAARNLRANELKNIVLTIKSDRWTWLNNKKSETITPNNIVTVISPENYIFKPTDFFVESVTLSLDSKRETAILTCVPPQVFNNQEPVNFFNA